MVKSAMQIAQTVIHTSLKHSQDEWSQSVNFLELEDTETAITCEAAPVQARNQVDMPGSAPPMGTTTEPSKFSSSNHIQTEEVSNN